MFNDKNELIKKMIDNDKKGLKDKFFVNGLQLGHDGSNNLLTSTGFKNGIKKVQFEDIRDFIKCKKSF